MLKKIPSTKGTFGTPADGTVNSVDTQLLAIEEALRQDECTASVPFDNALNLITDYKVGRYLGFKLVNIEKHGFDCYREEDGAFLESKVASLGSKSWNATFNDTTVAKANEFKKSNVWLALSVWKDFDAPLFILFGQHVGIGEFLERRVLNRKKGSRSTQSLSASKLYNEFGFKFIVPRKSLEDFRNIVVPRFKCVDEERVVVI